MKVGRPRKYKLRKGVTRAAISAAAIRAERRKKKLCVECGEPAAVKTIASTGKKKVLSRCQKHLDALAKRRVNRANA